MGSERRIYQRLLICVPCRIRHDGEPISGRSYDLSEGGAAIITDTELSERKTYELEIRWLQGEPSHFRGQVRYCRKLLDGHFMSGLQFIQPIPEQGREILKSLRPATE